MPMTGGLTHIHEIGSSVHSFGTIKMLYSKRGYVLALFLALVGLKLSVNNVALANNNADRARSLSLT